MTSLPDNLRNTILVGDALARLKDLPDESIHCAVSSPPYWGLREYGAEGQIGLEADFDEYLEKLFAVCQEVRRVLRKDGTFWLNLGDCYVASGCGGDSGKSGLEGSTQSQDESKRAYGAGPRVGHRSSFRRDRSKRQDMPHKRVRGLKPKDLVGLPWEVAFMLRDAGWWLRMDNLWEKSNPMPTSVRDRTTKAHEYLFHLAKSEIYYYDHFAILEPHEMKPQARPNGHKRRRPDRLMPEHTWSGTRRDEPGPDGNQNGRNKRSVWTVPTSPFNGDYCTACGRYYDMRPEDDACRCGRKDGWVTHFAVFPEKLIQPCILAGTSEHGACVACEAPWRRVLDEPDFSGQPKRKTARMDRPNGDRTSAGQAWQDWRDENPSVTVGWKPTCKCGTKDVRPCVVLDPFFGSGTTGIVALKAGRDFIACEINPHYAAMAEHRIRPYRAQARLF